MARKTEQGGGKPDEAPHDRAPGIETRIAQAGDELPALVPPGDRFGDPVHLQRVEPERFPDVAQRALGLISDERGRQRSALTAVFVIDVLDDFLAPLVLEIDVDIGRLVALLRNEALEQQLLLDRIDLGDAQGVADGGIGRRAAPLAETAPAAGVGESGCMRTSPEATGGGPYASPGPRGAASRARSPGPCSSSAAIQAGPAKRLPTERACFSPSPLGRGRG